MKNLFLILCAVVLCAGNLFAQAASDSKTVDCDGSVTITAAPIDGYHFVKWVKGTEEFTTNPLTVSNIKAAALYVAHFAADETTIDPSIDPGVVLPVPHGTELSITPNNTDDCLEFDHWSDITDPEDPLYAANPRSFTYNGVAPAFSAVFKTKTFSVTANTATGDATQGTVTVTIIPAP